MSTFRPIIPAVMGKLEDEAHSNGIEPALSEDVIRRRATTACLACKRRKIKVDLSSLLVTCGPRSLTVQSVVEDHYLVIHVE